MPLSLLANRVICISHDSLSVITWGHRQSRRSASTSRTGICSFVRGGTGGPLTEPYRTTSAYVHVSEQIVRIRLHEGGISPKCSLECPVLCASAKNSRTGRTFLSTDHSMFTLSRCGWCERVGRCCGEYCNACNIIWEMNGLHDVSLCQWTHAALKDVNPYHLSPPVPPRTKE